MSANTCPKCGGEMLPGVPGDLYCPEPLCMDDAVRVAASLVKGWQEREEREELARLSAKYGAVPARCAECDCENGGAECTWISAAEHNGNEQ